MWIISNESIKILIMFAVRIIKEPRKNILSLVFGGSFGVRITRANKSK